MNKYQLLFIIDNGIEEEAKDAIVTKFSDLIVSLGGTVNTVDKWGTRKYAYPINYKTEGFYVLMTFEAEAKVIAEIERIAGITDGIIRRLITKR